MRICLVQWYVLHLTLNILFRINVIVCTESRVSVELRGVLETFSVVLARNAEQASAGTNVLVDHP